jgi:hypothetical protein
VRFRRPTYPLDDAQREWLDGAFQQLIELFGADWVRRAPLVLPNQEFFPRSWSETEEWARYAFGRVCDLMKVDADRIDLEFVQDDWTELKKINVGWGKTHGAAGLYKELESEEGQARARIYLKDSLVKEPEILVATMSHELAHVLLLGDKKISRDLDRMEPLTDLMTVFCGFGVFTANSAHIHQSGPRGWKVSNLGYLSQREFGYSLALFAWAKGDRSPSWEVELAKNVRHAMKESLACFKAYGAPLSK